jgi:Ser/Thr protein kinase RdoA (MazF antagonist)
MSDATPFSNLTPECVMNALDAVGLRADGRLLALNSYENRVYQVGMEEGPPIVAKFYRPDRWTNEAILEEHDFVNELNEREIPVVPALTLTTAATTLHEYDGFRYAVFARIGGRAPELEQRSTLEWLGRFIGRMHAVAALKHYDHRPRLDIESFGEEPRDYLLTHGFIPADLEDAWVSVVEQALCSVRRAFDAAGNIDLLRLHGDCHAGNLLWLDGDGVYGPHIVDFDDSCMGPAIQDLWMLLSGTGADMGQQLSAVLSGYRQFFDFNLKELQLIEPLRTLRLIHYAAWIARRWSDPAFPVAFPWFNSQRYWQDRILELREQIAAMDEPPVQVALI